MRVPEAVRTELRQRVSALAKSLGWHNLSPVERTRHYRAWTEDPHIGGVLARFLNQSQIKVYIKDTLMKPYARARLSSIERVLRTLGMTQSPDPADRYTRPYGIRMPDGCMVTWGRAEDWKQVLMAHFERAFRRANARPYAVVLESAGGRFEQVPFRELVQEAAGRLGIERIEWMI